MATGVLEEIRALLFGSVQSAAASVIGAFTLGYTAGSLWQRFQHGRELAALKKDAQNLESELAAARQRLNSALEFGRTPARLWEARFDPVLANELLRPRTLKVLAVANLKGGVGKSTVAANLAAYFAEKRGLRVLLVDLDYQGTATQMANLEAGLQAQDSRVNDLLLNGAAATQPAIGIAGMPNLSFFSANEALDEAETRLLFQAAVMAADASDPRARLFTFLHRVEMAAAFDIVVCDTAPRFSAATVNALVAATSILVPTKLDSGSDMATVRFVNRLRSLTMTGFPSANFIGVLPSMTQQRPNFTPNEIEAANRIDERLGSGFDVGLSVIRAAWVPDTTKISGAGRQGLAYMRNSDACAIFNDVGDVIHARMF